MPRIDDIVQTTKKPFKKKAYRPWDLFDELPPKKEIQLEEKTVETSSSINKKSINVHTDVKIPSKQKITISKQLDNVLDNNMETMTQTNSYRKDNKNKTEIPLEKTISKQLDSRLVNALVNNFNHSPVKKRGLSEEISRLTGHQKKLLFFIVEDCALKGLLSTGQITNETLRNLLNTDQNTVKTSVHRLISKGLIKREEGKRGNGGFTCYTIPEEVRLVVNQEKIRISNQLDNALVTNRITDKITNPLSSSSFKELKTTTTELSDNTNNDWLNDIDIEPLHHIGFSVHYLKQITLQNNLTKDHIQESIYAYAFDLIENSKAQKIKEPIGYFMSVLKKGIPYAPPVNYESPKDKAMRIFLERKKEAEKRRLEMEEEAIKMACAEWINTLSFEEQDALVPEGDRKLQGLRMATIRTYFKENIWPMKKEEFFSKV